MVLLMKKKSIGVRRRSIFWGGLGAFVWLILILIVSDGLSNIAKEQWIVLFAGLGICFIIPFGLVRSIYWVVGGFKKDEKRKDSVTRKEAKDGED